MVDKKVFLVYDHFIAKGGAENFSLRVAELFNARLSTAYGDKEQFLSFFESGLLVTSSTWSFRRFSSIKLLIHYLFIFRYPKGYKNILLSGLFAPLSLIFNATRHDAKKIVYFHMYPTFLDSDLIALKKAYGSIIAPLASVAISGYRKLLKMALRRADVVVSNSRYTRQKVHELGIESKIVFPPVDVPEPVSCEGQYYLSTGRFEPNKNIDLILETFAQLKEQNLVVLAKGSQFSDLYNKYKSYSNISFQGWVEPSEVSHYYNQSKGLIYIAEKEAFGMSIAESLAHGKPVIAVNEGGAKELLGVEKALGFLLNIPPTVEQLKTAIKQLDTMQTSEQESVRRAAVEAYSGECFFQSLSEIID